MCKIKTVKGKHPHPTSYSLRATFSVEEMVNDYKSSILKDSLESPFPNNMCAGRQCLNANIVVKGRVPGKAAGGWERGKLLSGQLLLSSLNSSVLADYLN